MQSASAQEFKQAITEHGSDTHYDFINVCEPDEFRVAHIQGTRNVPLSSLMGRIGEFEGKTHIYVQCRSGSRSQFAINALARAGITAELINVDGGLIAWHSAGNPLQSLK